MNASVEDVPQYDFRVVCDRSNNPLESIAEGMLVVDIFVEPRRDVGEDKTRHGV